MPWLKHPVHFRTFSICRKLHPWVNPYVHHYSSLPNEVSPRNLSSRWLSDVKTRIGKCIMFGLKAHQIEEASSVLRIVATDWRELLVGSEGFLVGKGRAGLEKHQVVWGEMVRLHLFYRTISSLIGVLSSRTQW